MFYFFCMSSLHRVNRGDFVCLSTYLFSQATQWILFKFDSNHTKICQVNLNFGAYLLVTESLLHKAQF
jgi:hypothetical protein